MTQLDPRSGPGLGTGGAEPDWHILLVDDEESILFAMSNYLTWRGFAVDCARSRNEAEERLSECPYDLVLADLRLDVCDSRGGLRLVRWVREHFPRTRTVLLTAFGNAAIEAELKAIGADLLLSKPQPLRRIAEEILSLLSGRTPAPERGVQ